MYKILIVHAFFVQYIQCILYVTLNIGTICTASSKNDYMDKKCSTSAYLSIIIMSQNVF